MLLISSEDHASATTDETGTPLPKGPKVTQRMLQLRELIAEGTYPDKDELAEHIVNKL